MRKVPILAFAVLFLASADSVFSQDSPQEVFQPLYATVLPNKVNIRAGCGLNFEVIGRLNQDDEVVVTGDNYGWYKIKLPKTALSFAHKDYIDQGKVKANSLRIRAGRGLNFNVLGLLRQGDRVTILEEKGNWLKIAPPDTCSGWVKAAYLKLSQRRFVAPATTPPSSLQERQVEAGGIIDDLGKIVKRQGTHKLIQGKKIVYYLRSEDIDLNLYVYQKVQIKGILVDLKDSSYPVIDVKQVVIKQ